MKKSESRSYSIILLMDSKTYHVVCLKRNVTRNLAKCSKCNTFQDIYNLINYDIFNVPIIHLAIEQLV